MKPKAIGFLDPEISGYNQPKDEKRLRETVEDYDLARLFTPTHLVDEPIRRLKTMLDRHDASIVVTPSLEHLHGAEDALNANYTIITTGTPEPTVWAPGTLVGAAQ
jgi:hypothetical protein